MDLYRELCNKIGKVKVWSLNADELLDEVELIVREKIKQAKQEIFEDFIKVLKEFEKMTTYDYSNDYRIKELKKKHMEMMKNSNNIM